MVIGGVVNRYSLDNNKIILEHLMVVLDIDLGLFYFPNGGIIKNEEEELSSRSLKRAKLVVKTIMNRICEVVLPDSSEILNACCQNHQSSSINNRMNYDALLKNMAKLIFCGNRNVRMIIKILAATYFKHGLLRQFIGNQAEQQTHFSISEKKVKGTFGQDKFTSSREYFILLEQGGGSLFIIMPTV